jgi:hypothetical protein
MVASPRETAETVVQLARAGMPMPEEAITWALEISGDIPGHGWATAALWAFLGSIERAYR